MEDDIKTKDLESEVVQKNKTAKKLKSNDRLYRDDLDFVDDSKAALLARTTPLVSTVLSVIALLILIGLSWSRLAKLDEVTRGIGKIVPVSQIQIIQNLEGGILENVLVKEGQQVHKGQVIVQLDDKRFAAQYQQGYKRYLSLLANIARLQAETENRPSIVFPKEVEAYPSIVAQENHLFNTRKRLLENKLEHLKHSYQLAKRELNIIEPLVKKGVMSKIDLLRIQREIKVVEMNIDSFRDGFREEALSELNAKEADVAILSENLAALKDRMDRTTIRSPVNGIVKQIYFNTKGAVIEPARHIMEIVPVNDRLIVEARVKPDDIAFIQIGQKALVKVTAYDYAIFGGLKAKVTHISADTNITQAGAYYEVTLETEKNYLGNKEGSLPIMPGMVAIVDIITGKKPVLSYLLKPLLRAKEKALREQ